MSHRIRVAAREAEVNAEEARTVFDNDPPGPERTNKIHDHLITAVQDLAVAIQALTQGDRSTDPPPPKR